MVLVLVIFAVVVHAVCCYWNEGVQAFVYTAAVALDSRVAAYVVSVRRPRPTRELGFVAFQSKKIVELCFRASLLERPRVFGLQRSCDGAAVFTPSIDEGLLDGDESVAMEAIDEGQGLSIVFVSQVNLN